MKLDDIINTVSHSQVNRLPLNSGQDHFTHQSVKKQSDRRTNVSLQKSEIIPPTPDRIFYNNLEGANASSQALAKDIRSLDKTIQDVEKNVEKMNKVLTEIVKSYPPFLVGSNERINRLRQFNALRKIIDQLTFPPKDEDTPVKILGDKEAFSEAGDWEFKIEANNKQLVIRHQPMHPGPNGLDIPDLEINASDQEINNAIARLADAKENISRKRQAFIADANHVIASII
jgi:hypothetical protein